MGVGGQRHAPVTLPTGNARYLLYRRLGGPQGWIRRVQKISPPLIFDWIVQAVPSRYTDWAITAQYVLDEFITNKITSYDLN